MIVILLKDVKGTGKAGDVVKVKYGYARNKLIPGGFAKEATDGNVRNLERQKELMAKKHLGGHVNVSFLGALQVDEKGNLANWIIPGKMAPGMGGAMDLVVGAKRVILTMEHTQKGTPKILKQCTLPLTAAGQVNMIITEMGVMDITPEGIVLKEIHPEFTVEQVQAATEAKLIVAPDLKPMNI